MKRMAKAALGSLLALGVGLGTVAQAKAAFVPLPAITPETLGRANETLTFPGLKSSGARTTGLVIFNRGTSVARCSASVVGGEGIFGLDPIEIEIQPLGQERLADVFAGRALELAGARAEVTCSNEFYAYAEVADAGTGRLRIVGPAQPGDGLTSLFDEVVKSAVNCGDGRKLCELLGVVHTSSKADPTVAISMTPPVGTYKSMRAHVEVTVTGWNKANVRGAHGMIYVVINRNKSLLGNVFLRGPGKESLTLRHGVCPNGCTKSKVEKPLKVTLGQTLTLDYLYDVGNRRTDLRITDGNGQLLAQINDAPNVKNIFIENKDRVIIGLSNPSANSREEPASLGWVYKNLRVEFFN